MKTDLYTRAVLTVIAIALVAIAFKMNYSNAPVYGDYINLANLEGQEAKDARIKDLMKRTPLVWVKGGSIDAEVTGTVSID